MEPAECPLVQSLNTSHHSLENKTRSDTKTQRWTDTTEAAARVQDLGSAWQHNGKKRAEGRGGEEKREYRVPTLPYLRQGSYYTEEWRLLFSVFRMRRLRSDMGGLRGSTPLCDIINNVTSCSVSLVHAGCTYN